MKNNFKKPKVIICGAGIGGLTVAHELAKKDFDITVYERNDIVGGLARSKYYKNKLTSNEYPVEYSWRIYGRNYKNLLRIMGEIPLSKEREKSVISNLIESWTYIFPRFGKKEVILPHNENKSSLLEGFTINDKISALNKVFYCLTMSKGRMDSLDHIKWKDFCKDLSPEAKKYLVRLWGPVLGMDPSYMSFPVIARIMPVLLNGALGRVDSLFLMDKPTNDGWFDEWVYFLKNKKSVKIKTNCEILDFQVGDNRINRVLIKDQNNKIIEESADYYICGLAVESIAKIVSKNDKLSKFPSFNNTIDLAQKSRQIQLSVQIFLDQKIEYPSKGKLLLYLSDTPWALIIEPQTVEWGETYCTDKRVKSILSVGICQTDKPGIVYNKPFVKCTEAEIKKEVWAQILKSYEMSSILTESGEKINKAKIILFYMWDSFKFDNNKKQMDVWEPKFSNNINSLKYQPNHLTEIPNFLFATGYTKTDRFIYSMESAAEAGTLCANEVIRNQDKKNDTSSQLTKIYPFSSSSMIIFKPLIFVDKILFKLKLPHLSKLTFNNNIVLVSLYGILLLLTLIVVVILFI